MRVKMLNSRTVEGEGSKVSFIAGHYYLLPDELATRLVAEGDAESDSATSAAAETGAGPAGQSEEE